MKIETQRLIIRPFKKSDYKQVQACCNDYDLAKTTLSIPIPYSDTDAKNANDRTNIRKTQ